MLGPKPMQWLLNLAVKVLIRTVAAIVLVIATVSLLMGFMGRAQPPLQPWHESAPEGEFEAGDAGDDFDFEDYLKVEDALFAQLGQYAISPDDLHGHSKYIRYVTGGPHSPGRFTPDWNRSFELVPDRIRGGVLLLHGLSDSPYSLRSEGEMFYSQGYYVLGMRMPGHGTVPAALLDVSSKDWAAAVRIGARHVRQRIGERVPFCICGYSNGGALAVYYSLESVEDDDLPVPDRVFLFSPAIGITRLAFASNWHKVFSWIPYFRKSKWLNIKPEIDPFKYNSFTKNAGAQSWDLAAAVQKRLSRAAVQGKLPDIPPIMTFQSAADSTIIARDVVTRLYGRLPANGSELIAFDVNRVLDLEGLYKENYRRSLAVLEDDPNLDYTLTVVTNADPDSLQVVARSKPPRSTEIRVEPLDIAWPHEVYSLAHVAIPFPMDDPVYGTGSGRGDGNQLYLGDLSMRGEIGVMRIPADELMRLRHNPFHAYMIGKIRQSIAAPATAPAGDPGGGAG